MEKENYQFRIMYFIGIVTIVAGHCGRGGISLAYEWFPPSSFQLCLFMFCSGYFFCFNKNKSIKEIITKKIKKLIVPFYLWNIFYGIVITILHYFGIKFGNDVTLHTLFLKPLYSGHQFIFNLGSWFIVPLFITQVFSSFWVKLLNKYKSTTYIVFIIYMLLGFLGVHLAMNGYNSKWYLFLTRILVLLPFFGLGVLYKEKLEQKDKCKNSIYFAVIFSILIFCIYYNGGTRGYQIVWCKDFDNIFMPYILGTLGILFWLRVSKILEPALKNSKLVNLIAKNTFAIMMHQIMGFFLVNCFWLVMSKLISSISGFNYNSFVTSIWYIYLPKGIAQFKILYLLAGIFFPLLVVYIKDKLINLKKSRS